MLALFRCPMYAVNAPEQATAGTTSSSPADGR